ncbi:MAG: Crp/Fnr family transcriptional regulator [Alphaproteobacteria bacterium]|nr:Crp/Fnr family transcriptional regulator [Alphaproteobacteria bacterium]
MISSLEQRRALLAGVPLFATVSPEILKELAARSSTVQLAPHDSLFLKGDAGERLYVVISGLIRVGAVSPEGREVTYSVLGPGELLGEIAVLDGGERSADATAMEESLLLSLERRDILTILDRSPAQALRLISVLCHRVRRADEMLDDVVFMSLPSRLAKHLLKLGEMRGSGQEKAGPVEIRFSQQELSEHLAISRESVNKVLSKWEEAGIVKLGRGRISVVRVALLQEIASPT